MVKKIFHCSKYNHEIKKQKSMTYAKTKGQATARISFYLLLIFESWDDCYLYDGLNTYLWWLCDISKSRKLSCQPPCWVFISTLLTTIAILYTLLTFPTSLSPFPLLANADFALFKLSIKQARLLVIDFLFLWLAIIGRCLRGRIDPINGLDCRC